MQQLDLFEETLEKKIYRMEKWMSRLQRELWFLQEVYRLTKISPKTVTAPQQIEQMDMFSA